MAVAIHVDNHAASDPTTSVGEPIPTIVLPIKAPASHINTSPLPSVGIPAAAAELGDKDGWDTWHMMAQDWYAEVLKDTPGTGHLQYYLGTLSWDLKGEELRTMYHFIKSLVAKHLFDRGREAVLDLFSPSTQQTLSLPMASAPLLFLHIQGLLFTCIDLDQVKLTLTHFIKCLELDTGSPEESDWTMMAILSIRSLLEFGKATGQLHKVGGLGAQPTEKNLSLEIECDDTAEINSQNQKHWADQEDED
ncbi:hypothetical protein BS47DRAFT_1447159 [Hydnum rufescens UP504]|uniref:Uncharacterized protein n=1 Tax=Hydnum rufescens UP504 TaxID=1448309 RepID=A0A9P6BAB1_9AGAM|nr:hypothetical protein BS47DRAFT_1447159 [Hydnum rufescens UP504]